MLSTTRTTIVAAVLAAVSAAGPAAAGDRMSEAEMTRVFAGMTLDGIYEDGVFFSETYFEDGSIRYHDLHGADSGDWSVHNGAFCTFYQSQTGACFFVVRDGENCFTFHEAMENDEGRLVPRPQWTSRGWDRKAESTCPTPPAAEI